MPRLFPEVDVDQNLASWDDQALAAGLRAICAQLNLTGAALTRFHDGSRPVYAVGDERVLKVYPPFERRHSETEAAVLAAIDGRMPIPTPALCAVGQLEGWSYVLMQRLSGQSLAEVWPLTSAAERLSFANVLGETLATLHQTRAPDLPMVRVDWAEFLRSQRATCVARQRSRGVDEHWLQQIPEFLDAVELPSAPADALLHTEVMREHLLATNGPGGWKLSGLFDFEPAMRGAAEYEFGAVGLFFSCGTPRLLRRVLQSYGYGAATLDAALQHRLMAYKLLHRYSNLRWYLERLPPSPDEQTLSALAEKWWALNE